MGRVENKALVDWREFFQGIFFQSKKKMTLTSINLSLIFSSYFSALIDAFPPSFVPNQV